MFEMAVMEERTGRRWGLIAGLLTFVSLLSGTYVLVI
jgi:hypothetical protein